MKFMNVSEELAQQHYAVHKERPFYKGLVEFITSGPVMAIAVEGDNAIKVTRTLVGITNPAEAAPGTIRGDYGMDIGRNLIHASDSVENAEYELGLYFTKEEYVDWKPVTDSWLYE
jgi:nucleoside-diphosphate kinase